jgi:uncharacterized protein YprB with RNaseH-like and TPR domain
MKRLEIFDRTRSIPLRNRGNGESSRPDASLVSLARRIEGRIIKEGGLSLLEVEQQIGKKHTHGTVYLGAMEELQEEPLNVLFPMVGATEGRLAGKGFLFFDIETTGLSTGAGTRFFLIGMLKVFRGEIRLLQYFLTNLRSEPFFLRWVNTHLGGDDVLVSYNGKSFDYNVIHNRYILNGLDLDDVEKVHLDLLYTARRLWRGLCPDFTLATVEREVLGFHRQNDIPGDRIPDVYSRYLREGCEGDEIGDEIAAVFIHNRNDLLSLLALMLKQVHTVREGMGTGSGGLFFNPVSLSDMLYRSGLQEDAKRVLLSRPGSTEAAKRLGLLFKREGAYREALDHFERVVERTDSIMEYLFSCTEIAKIYEHALKDYTAALVYARMAHDRLSRRKVLYPEQGYDFRNEITAVEKRIARLSVKIERTTGRRMRWSTG